MLSPPAPLGGFPGAGARRPRAELIVSCSVHRAGLHCCPRHPCLSCQLQLPDTLPSIGGIMWRLNPEALEGRPVPSPVPHPDPTFVPASPPAVLSPLLLLTLPALLGTPPAAQGTQATCPRSVGPSPGESHAARGSALPTHSAELAWVPGKH